MDDWGQEKNEIDGNTEKRRLGDDDKNWKHIRCTEGLWFYNCIYTVARTKF